MAAGLFGALPFSLGGVFNNFTDAFFESVSGFTTTGASVLTDIESVSKGFLFWRSFIQWLGGMGIIVLSLAILPFIGIGGMQLYKAEVPSPVPDKLKPRIRDTAMILWKVYAVISLAEVFFLMIGGWIFMKPYVTPSRPCRPADFQPETHRSPLSTVSTWMSSSFFSCSWPESIFLFTTRRSGGNRWLSGAIRSAVFLAAVVILIAVVSIDTYGSVYRQMGQSLRYAAFQVVSIITTTGYATADYEKWPAMSQLILLLCMFLGASAGSTGGGMKCLRAMLYFKFCYKELFSLIHPHAVTHVKISGKPVAEDVMRSVLGFLGLYLGLFAFCSVLLAGLGVDFVTSFGAIAAAMGNIGPGFGMVGPVDNYAQIPFLGKWLLIWCMLLGRLEIYTIIILLVPEFWRK